MNFKHYLGLALIASACLLTAWGIHDAEPTFGHAALGIVAAAADFLITLFLVLKIALWVIPALLLAYGVFSLVERRKYGWKFLRANRYGNYAQPFQMKTGVLVRAEPGNYQELPEHYHNSPHVQRVIEAQPQELLEAGEARALPDRVLYDEVRPLIPPGRVLVGVGTEGVQHEDEWARGLLWIAGSSSAGKTNTTVVRVDESYERGYTLLGIDPHAFKPDSFKNAVSDYLSRFQCIAQKEEHILEVLRWFKGEFLHRRDEGTECYPVHLYIDEVSSLTSDKPENQIQEANRRAIRELARIAGEEMRGFNMGVTMISQTGTGMAWLRKYALMVLGHKVTMMAERQLVCNERTEIARDMDTWPKGRTIAYGVALPGVYVVQQPLLVMSSSKKSFVNVHSPFNQPEPDVHAHSNVQTAFAFPRTATGDLVNDVNAVNAPPTPDEYVQNIHVTSDERARIIGAAMEQRRQNVDGKVVRTKVLEALDWHRGYFPKVKQVLDEEGL